MYQPNFTITNSILKNIGLIEAAKALIDASPLLPSWEKRFKDEAVVRSVHHGTHLEGNELNFSEAKRVIEGEAIVARERDIQEVINYRNVIDFIGKTRVGRKPTNAVMSSPPSRVGTATSAPGDFESWKITEELIKKLHRLTTEKILPAAQAGKYRKTSVVIRNSQTGTISFRPPPAIEVPYLIRSFLDWLSDSSNLHAALKAGIAHYEIVRIHPFTDGNGRVARAATMLVLYQRGYDIRRFFSLEEYYDRNAENYYKALQSVSSPSAPSTSSSLEPPTAPRMSDLTPWLEYFTEGLAIEFNSVKEKIERISRDLNLKNALGAPVYLNDRQLKIIEHIQEIGFLQNKSFSGLFPKLSDDTILRELKDLMKKHIIKKKGRTKAARYVLA